MKNRIFILSLIVLNACLTSCSSLLSPQFAESQEVLEYVFDHTYVEMLEDWFGTALFHGDPNPAYNENSKSANVTMLDWRINVDIDGDDFIGYYIIYEVQYQYNTYYTLVDLVEWFDGSHYQKKIIAVERTISDIYSYLY